MMARIISTILLCLIFLHVALAQTSFTPQSTWGSASIYIEGRAFYIQSGRPNGLQTWVTQTFSISLATAWNVTAPAFTQLKNGLDGHVYPSALLLDGVTWGAIRNNTYFTYNLNRQELTKKNPVANFNGVQALAAARDPSTGELVIPAAALPTLNGNATMRFGPTTETQSTQPRFTDVDGHQYYTIVASDSAQAMFYFGGLIVNEVFATFAKLDYGSPAWAAVTVSGSVTPPARAVSCLVAAYGGTKLILMGGEGANKTVLSDIYVFDVATSTWTKGPDGGVTRQRAGHTCAVSGDNLVFYGGYSSVSGRLPVPELVSVYSLTASAWQQAFVPAGPIPSPISSPGPSLPDSGSGSPGKSKVGAIAGGSGGAVAVILIAALVFWTRRRKRSQAGKEEEVIHLAQTPSSTLPGSPHNNPQLYRGNSVMSVNGKLAQRLLSNEDQQYAPIVPEKAAQAKDSAVGHPESMPWGNERLKQDIMNIVTTTPPPSSLPRGPQACAATSWQATPRNPQDVGM
ncbi:hypothetical protein EMPS_03080 [Entomortierella parvispora]|uniref:Galactose oxidase n=1 Tax=Entomortierella parvispora TaxID=205924 RepID=A0A9P3H649_9FUNG|nr:hypothetical protein EMPS_03080 [Entomortierella parvispora]